MPKLHKKKSIDHKKVYKKSRDLEHTKTGKGHKK